MKRILFIFVALITVISVSNLQAQSIDEILKKHFKAIGQESLIKQKTVEMKGKILQMGMEMPMDMKLKRPDKFKMEIDIQGQKMVQAFDGTSGWMIAPWVSPDPQDLAGDQLKQAKEQADLDGQLYNYKEKGNTVELIGSESLDGADVYHLKMTTKDKTIQEIFIDKKSMMIISVKTTVEAQGQKIEIKNIMSNFKTFDGVTMAMTIQSNSPMGQTSIIFDSVEFNKEIDDSFFARPSK